MDYLKLVPQLTRILPSPSTTEPTDCFWLKVVIDLLFTKEEGLSVIVMLLTIIKKTLENVNVKGAEINNDEIAYNIFVKELLIQAFNSRATNTPKIRIIFDLLLIVFGVELKTIIHGDGSAFMKIEGQTTQITNFYTETETCQTFKTKLMEKLLQFRDATVQQIIKSINLCVIELGNENKFDTAHTALKGVIDADCENIEGKLLEDQIAIVLSIVQTTNIVSTFKSVLAPWSKDLTVMFAKYVGNSAVSGVKYGVSGAASALKTLGHGVSSLFSRTSSSGGKRKHQTRKRYKRRKR